MTTEEMRVAAAGSVGWTDCFIATGKEEFLGTFAHEYEGKLMGFPHYRKDVQIVPFYDADLNAIAGLEDTLEIGHDGSEAANYQETLYGIVNSGRDFIEDFCNGADVAFLHKLITASAAHRLEAYLRVKELWKD